MPLYLGNIVKQGPVDYTAVGSPLIVDGVASGFSRNDYLAIQHIQENSDFEFNIRFVLSDTTSSANVFRLGPSAYRGILQQQSTTKLRFSYREIGNSTTLYDVFDIITGISINFNMKYTHNDNSVLLNVIQNNTLIHTKTISNVDNAEFTNMCSLGSVLDSAFQDGASSINLNETYIKVNCQAWFGPCKMFDAGKYNFKF